MPTLPHQHVVRVAAEILRRLGTPEDIAASIAEWLVSSDLSGHPSHGVMRVENYAKRIRSGDLVPTGRPRVVRGAEEGPVVLIDGCSGYGHLAADALVRLLVERVRQSSVAVGGIVNASHTGRLGEWSEFAARHGTILLMCSASLSRGNVAAFGAREARLGTNPITIATPAGDGDYAMADFATSAISGGKVDHLIRAGEPAPADSLLDRDGNPTTDPSALSDGGMLLPFGGHKGYALSVLISILAGCVVGQAAPGNPRHGVFAVAVDPGAFAERELVLEAVRVQLDRMRTTRPRAGFDRVEVPGDFERRNREEHDRTVPVADSTWESVLAVGESLGLSRDDLAREHPA